MKLNKFLDDWLNNVIRVNVRVNTYAVYKGYIENHINRLIGELDLCELKAEALQGFIYKLISGEKSSMSAKGVNAIFSMLSSALDFAVEYEYIQKNPCTKVKLPKPKEKEIQVFDRSEQAKLECMIVTSEDKRNYAILLCLYTGIRIGELCALKWENVNFEYGQIIIKYSMIRIKNYGKSATTKTKLVLEEPKTVKSKRVLPIPEFLCDILKVLKLDSNSEFVFSVDGIKSLQPRTLQVIYQRLLKKSELKYRNFHALRHTFATRAIELGVDVKTLSEVLGHSNATITINRYAHSLMEQKQNMMCLLNQFFNNKKTNLI